MADTELQIKISAKLDELRSGLAETKQQLNTIENATVSTSSGFKALESSASSFKSILIGFGSITFASGLAKDILDTNRSMEMLRAQLLALTGSTANAEATFSYIQKFAKDTPFEIDGLTKTFIALQNFGIKPTEQVMQALTNQASKLGASQETLTSIAMQLGQAYSKGKLQQEDMVVLAERGVPVYRLLAEVMHKSTAEIMDMSAKGTITTDVIDRLIAKMGEAASGSNAAAMDTLNGKISNLSDSWKRFEDTLLNSKGEGVIKGITDSVTRLIDMLNRNLSDDIDSKIAHAQARVKTFESMGAVGRAMGDYTGYDINLEKNKIDALMREKEKLAKTAGIIGGEQAPQIKSSDAPDKKAEATAEKAAEKAAERAKKARERQIEQDLTMAEQEATAIMNIEENAEKLKESLMLQGYEHRKDVSLKEIDDAEDQAKFEREIGIKSQSDFIKDEMAFEKQKYEVKKQALLDSQKLNLTDYKEQARIKNELTKLDIDYAAKQKKLDREKMKDRLSIFHDIFSGIKMAFNQSIQGMIQGTLTLKDALANIGQSILASFVQLGVDMLTSWIEKQIAMLIFGQTTMAEDVATTLGGNVMKAESNAAVAAVAAAQSVAAIPYVGWAMAPGVAAETYAAMQPFVALASAAGGFDIPAGVNPITQLHEKEMVLPAKHADVIRSLADGGIKSQAQSSNVNVNFNVSAIDAAGVKKFFADNGKHIASAVASQQRIGSNKLRSMA